MSDYPHEEKAWSSRKISSSTYVDIRTTCGDDRG